MPLQLAVAMIYYILNTFVALPNANLKNICGKSNYFSNYF